MAPACRCLWCAFFSSFAAVLLGNTAISGSAFRMNSTAWWLISLLFCIFTYTDLTIALVLGTLTIAHTTGATWQAPDAGSLTYPLCSFWKWPSLCQSPKGPLLDNTYQRKKRIRPLKCRQRSPAYGAELLGLTSWRQPSQALDDGQLALYLQFRGVSFDTVMDWGVYFYLEQHQHDSDDQRRELLQQLHAMLGTRDIFDALCFYRYMLEGQVRDEFYAELYNQIASRIQHHPRPAFFADALRALSQQRDDADDTDDACPDTKPADTASTTTAACFASCSRMDVPPISQETRPGSHCTYMFRRAELDLECMPWFCQVA